MGWETPRAERQAAQSVGQGITPGKPISEFSCEGPGILHQEDQENSKLNRRTRSTENQSGDSSVAQSHTFAVSVVRPLWMVPTGWLVGVGVVGIKAEETGHTGTCQEGARASALWMCQSLGNCVQSQALPHG